VIRKYNCAYPPSHSVPSALPSAYSILTLQLLLNRLNFLRIANLDYPARLALVAHQLLRASIQRVGEQDEARRVVRQLVAEVLHVGVDCVGGGGWVDFEGLFVDLVFFLDGGG
jgi:hypothetical protein